MTASPSPHATVLTVLNLKGGVGKTHTTWLLASVSHERGKRLLAIDTNPQGNPTNSFFRDGEKTPGVERLLDPSTDADVHGLIRRTQYPTIDIIHASSAVVRFDLSDQLAWEQADLHRSFVEPVNELRDRYDLIVFDCPPRLSLTSFAALCASDFVIVPLETAAGEETPLFPNRHGQPLSRSGVEDRLQRAVDQAAQRCPNLRNKTVSPHTLRHTTAMHLLQADVDVTLIALWLGHESSETTHQYVEADLEMKRRVLKRMEEPPSKSKRRKKPDPLLDFLDRL